MVMLMSAVFLASGQIVGAAACATGSLVNALAQREGFFPDPAAEVQRATAAIVAVAERAPRLAHSGTAKLGAAAGLAAILGAQHASPGLPADPSFLLSTGADSGAAKEALQVMYSHPAVHKVL